jgi:large subunit ribosomal protein L24
MATIKARKQRKRAFNAPLHVRRKMLSAHLASKYLEDEKSVYPRAIPVRKGDTVYIMRGDDKGKEGKVATVDYRGGIITVEGITHAKADGKQVAKKIHPSNVMITKIDDSDAWRKGKLESLGKRE